MTIDKIQGFMYGLGAGFIIAHILKVAPHAGVPDRQAASGVQAVPDTRSTPPALKVKTARVV